MIKFLPEHRKQIGSFEVVEVADEREAARLRAHVNEDVSIAVNWTWEYGSEVAELRSLYEKGKTAQWNAETDLDWSIPVTPNDWVLAPEGSLLAQIFVSVSGGCNACGHCYGSCAGQACDAVNKISGAVAHAKSGHGLSCLLDVWGALINAAAVVDNECHLGE